MKALRATLLMFLAVATLAAATLGVSYAVKHRDAGPPATQTSTTPNAEDQSAPVATQEAPGPVLRPGDRGKEVRELQHRLFQLAWWPEETTGIYDDATRAAVRGFQEKRGFKATGILDRRTWRRLKAMSEPPTRDQLFNILRPGPALLAPGAEGNEVREAQARLKQIAWLSGDVTGSYDDDTVAAVRGFQEKREIPVTGEIDQRTLDRLESMTTSPTYEEMHNIEPLPDTSGAPLDPRCTTGRALCVDKSSQTVRWVVDGVVRTTMDARFGSTVNGTPTREGLFSVTFKSRDHVSSLYDTEMPFAMFFSGGQAVHYSADFAANGYNGASHGCVNIRDYDTIAALFDEVQVGDRVVVYWS